MCNEYQRLIDLNTIRDGCAGADIALGFPEGLPNLGPAASIRITDPGAILRMGKESGQAELVVRRWSWPGPGGKPVYNFRADGRTFDSGRCLIVADGFYEYTAPEDPKQKRKDKWLLKPARGNWFAIAGLWRTTDVGEAFTMLTVPPGADIQPFHDRQVAILSRADWARWLDPATPARDMLHPLAAGTLKAERVA